jgi:hypothetical protein
VCGSPSWAPRPGWKRDLASRGPTRAAPVRLAAVWSAGACSRFLGRKLAFVPAQRFRRASKRAPPKWRQAAALHRCFAPADFCMLTPLGISQDLATPRPRTLVEMDFMIRTPIIFAVTWCQSIRQKRQFALSREVTENKGRLRTAFVYQSREVTESKGSY